MKKVGIIIGGRTVEHEVSIITGLQIYDNIDRTKYQPYVIYIDKKGKWNIGDSLGDINTYKNKSFDGITEVIPWQNFDKKNTLTLHPNPDLKQGLFAKKREKLEVEVVIPAVHGTSVEDGALQGILESCEVPYCFTGVKASALGMDKVSMKKIFHAENLPMVDHIWFYRSQYRKDQEQYLEKAESIGYPLIVKPANLGSSVGISKATNREELMESIEVALSYDKKILVEQCIENLREINCAVIGYEDDVEASLCEEPIGWEEFLKYEDKYMSGKKGKGSGEDKRIIPADIPDEVSQRIRELAKKAFMAIDASGTSRVDFLYDNKNIYVNEINTIPGSISFYLWEPSGLPFKELITRLIEIAETRHNDEAENIVSYDIDLLNNMAKGAKN
ncbi:D-alanine-D-alanine ligase [Dethiosulfatibacter aminovorans DSM 17477]|uniref:D-alanine--D-alanine ligase n=1 Tax=Dethiosulfatibacter aminovorans DSM 17477 TaxID=1121476 RepID=A0A1M6FDQ5_9FIRM|nr:D-alanine--D-alanine ligase family protein [Dethiosulfatibacter aminovorans]SHI95874.1 D-alanine-D-alanine ligase [Dethiosulfatibacter aminovorans DSM 17477]